ncbi:MAG: GNAT family N-acetyltransferase, partial [Desulfovibrionaceae bacterium]|nr:GNAT family N-acetyltransferase [Desulfovibrionaceae bacterium]
STTFYRQLLAAFAALNHARVIFARDEDQDIGFIFGGLSNNIYRGQQFSFSEAYKKYSIGNILQYEKIAWLCEDKIGRYDMGPISGPKMEYKAHWTELVFPLQSWILYPKSVPKDQLI